MIVRAWRPATGHLGAILFARPQNCGLAFLFTCVFDLSCRSKEGDGTMKLYLLFALMDALILLAYPILFIVSKLRDIAKNKR
jgi:hypothetical protein